MPKTLPLAQYVFNRLKQLKCPSIHGVPGDYLLRALDHIQPSGLKWIGNANELCAGYAADGYARAGHHIVARRGAGPKVGALLTTYGVGELSAINAVAGSFAESIPVVHLVGTPSRKAWQARSATRPVHHTLGDGRMDVYSEMAKQITCAQANLHEFEEAADAVQRCDEVLAQCVQHSKPVYVSIPSDMIEMPAPTELLERTLRVEPQDGIPGANESLVEQMAQMITEAQEPLLIADGLSYPYDLAEEANTLVDIANLPAMSFASGKGIIAESKSNWKGCPSGSADFSRTLDLVIILGPLLSNTNTSAWTAVPSCEQTILVNRDTVEVNGRKHNYRGKLFLRDLIAKLKRRQGHDPMPSKASISCEHHDAPLSGDGRIEQDAFWQRMSKFLRPADTILFANGTPLVGSRDMTLPSQTQVIASSVWCSIGHMLPAAQGVALAKRDNQLPGRTILFEGDGSFQVTCQALSDIIRYKLDVTIFIVNNAGYTYERWLNGMEAEYNNVPDWQYTQAPSFFGAKMDDPIYPILTQRVETQGGLEEVLKGEELSNGKGLKVIDVVMDAQDVPEKARFGLLRASEVLKATPR